MLLRAVWLIARRLRGIHPEKAAKALHFLADFLPGASRKSGNLREERHSDRMRGGIPAAGSTAGIFGAAG
jgi:hypothetical protein